jgi:O-antigen/teichoic acid export membrane protein
MLGLSRLFAMTTTGSALLTVVAVVGGAAGGGAVGLAVALSVVMAVTNLWVFWVATRAIRRVAREESDSASLLSAAR